MYPAHSSTSSKIAREDSQNPKQQSRGRQNKSFDSHKNVVGTQDKGRSTELGGTVASSSSRRGASKIDNMLQPIQNELKKSKQVSTSQPQTQRKKSKNNSVDKKVKDPAGPSVMIAEDRQEPSYPATRSKKSLQHRPSNGEAKSQQRGGFSQSVDNYLHDELLAEDGNINELYGGEPDPVSPAPYQHLARRWVSGYSNTLRDKIDRRFDPPALRRANLHSPKLVFTSPRETIAFRYLYEEDLINFTDPTLSEKVIEQTMDQDYDTDESIENNTTHKMIRIFEGTLGIAGYDAKGKIRMVKKPKIPDLRSQRDFPVKPNPIPNFSGRPNVEHREQAVAPSQAASTQNIPAVKQKPAKKVGKSSKKTKNSTSGSANLTIKLEPPKESTPVRVQPADKPQSRPEPPQPQTQVSQPAVLKDPKAQDSQPRPSILSNLNAKLSSISNIAIPKPQPISESTSNSTTAKGKHARKDSSNSKLQMAVQSIFKSSPESERSAERDRKLSPTKDKLRGNTESTRATARNTQETTDIRRESDSITNTGKEPPRPVEREKGLAPQEKISYYNRLLEETEMSNRNVKTVVHPPKPYQNYVRSSALIAPASSNKTIASVTADRPTKNSQIVGEIEAKDTLKQIRVSSYEINKSRAESSSQNALEVFKQAIGQGLLDKHFSGILCTIEELVSNVCKSVPQSTKEERFSMAKICIENLQNRAQLVDGQLKLKPRPVVNPIDPLPVNNAHPSAPKASSRGITQEKIANVLAKQVTTIQTKDGWKASAPHDETDLRPQKQNMAYRSESLAPGKDHSKNKLESKWVEAQAKELLNRKQESNYESDRDRYRQISASVRDFNKHQPTRSERKQEVPSNSGSRTMQKFQDSGFFDSDYNFPMKPEFHSSKRIARESSVPPQSSTRTHGIFKIVDDNYIEIARRSSRDRRSNSGSRDEPASKPKKMVPVPKSKLEHLDRGEQTPISKRTRSSTVYVEVDEKDATLGKRKRREDSRKSEVSERHVTRDHYESSRPSDKHKNRTASERETGRRGTVTEHKFGSDGIVSSHGYYLLQQSKARLAKNTIMEADESDSPNYRR